MGNTQPRILAWGAKHYTLRLWREAKSTKKTEGGSEKRTDQVCKGWSTEVCKCKFTKLVPGARALTFTDPGEVKGKQEPLNRIRAGGLWRARRGPRKTKESEDEEEVRDLTEENRGDEKGGKQRGEDERKGK